MLIKLLLIYLKQGINLMLADTLFTNHSQPEFERLPNGTSVSIIFKYIESRIKGFYKFCLGKGYNEEQLNDRLIRVLTQGSLCDYPFRFVSEPRSEIKSDRRKPDIGVIPAVEDLGVEVFFYLEAKRLPPTEPKRKYEYVLGDVPNSGGIERYKRGLHGKNQRQCGMIGYVEQDCFEIWFNSINKYIESLVQHNTDKTIQWTDSEKLVNHYENSESARYHSVHLRNNGLDPIILHHLWLNMIPKPS